MPILAGTVPPPANRDVPGPGQESVWDHPRPPRVEPVPERLRVVVDGQTIAETTRGFRVCETAGPPVYYLPPEDVRTELLTQTRHHSICEWKGTADYWSLQLGERKIPNVAWSYPKPMPGYEVLKDYLAFYAGKVDAAFVGDEQVTAQPGHFYGGWITSKIVGPFKGGPGSVGW